MFRNVSSSEPRLRVLLVLRSPVGGLFRHVRDLARALGERGHAVGIVADATTGGPEAEATFRALAPLAPLGISRVPMPRDLGLSDAAAFAHVLERARAARADILHGHGAKGGAYARLVGTALRRQGLEPARIYTPHGGSLHYSPFSPVGMVYIGLERALRRLTDAAIFESAYGCDTYARKVGTLPGLSPVVHNGLAESEFEPVAAGEDAADFLFVGELRVLKGVDLLLRALARLGRDGMRPSLVVVGAGPDEAAFRALVGELRLEAQVRFVGAMPARRAFGLARCMVVPSRAESLPYIVLEAAAAAKPLIATRVGGIPEILGDGPHLVRPAEEALAAAMLGVLRDPAGAAARSAAAVAGLRRSFSIDAMAEGVVLAYRNALAGSVALRPQPA